MIQEEHLSVSGNVSFLCLYFEFQEKLALIVVQIDPNWSCGSGLKP